MKQVRNMKKSSSHPRRRQAGADKTVEEWDASVRMPAMKRHGYFFVAGKMGGSAKIHRQKTISTADLIAMFPGIQAEAFQ